MKKHISLQKILACACALTLTAGITACGAAGGNSESSAASEASSEAASSAVSQETVSQAATNKADTKVGTLLLSVNPEIEIDFDKDGKVTDIDGLNEDARALGLREADYIGRDCKAVVKELVQKISAAGYFDNTIDGHTKNIVIKLDPESHVPGETFLPEVQKEADSAIAEIKLENDAIVVTGDDLDQSGYIGLDKAKEIVLSQLDLNEASFYDHEYDLDDGVYEFEFTVNGVEYEYEVDARTGKVLKADIDRNDDWDDRENWKVSGTVYSYDDDDDDDRDDIDDIDDDDDRDDIDDYDDDDDDRAVARQTQTAAAAAVPADRDDYDDDRDDIDDRDDDDPDDDDKDDDRDEDDD